MTRSFDAFDRDDFRNPDDLDRGASGGSESFWSVRVRLSELHRKEERADAREREGRERLRQDRPPLRREERVREILEQRIRTVFRNRDKTYELRDSEIHLLSEVGKFRVVAQNDLAEFAYNGDRNRVEHDIENLERQGLAEVKTILGTEHNPIGVVTLTKEGAGWTRPVHQASSDVQEALRGPPILSLCVCFDRLERAGRGRRTFRVADSGCRFGRAVTVFRPENEMG
jgi:hypothetical protein